MAIERKFSIYIGCKTFFNYYSARANCLLYIIKTKLLNACFDKSLPIFFAIQIFLLNKIKNNYEKQKDDG